MKLCNTIMKFKQKSLPENLKMSRLKKTCEM